MVECDSVFDMTNRFGPLEQYRDVAKRLLKRQLDRGELTLLVDALDQVDHRSGASVSPIEHARSLADFIRTHPEVRVIVSGRPSSILDYWQTLFDTEGSQDSPWRFVQVDEFTPEQIEVYLGDRWPAVQSLDAETLAIPRALEQVLQLQPDELRQIRTRGELYWYCLDKPFDRAIERELTTLTRGRAEFLLGLLAIECIQGEHFQSLEGDDYTTFRRNLWRDRQEMLRDEFEDSNFSASQLDRLLCELANLNHHLDPGAIKDGCSSNSPGQMVRLCWHNNTTLCFYAAFWMVRFACDKDRDWLDQHLFLRGTASDHPLYEFWRFIVEMPGPLFPLKRPHSSIRREPHYVQAVALLFARGDRQRSTEMLWRAWPEVLRLAGEKVTPDSGERDVELATWSVARQVQSWVDSGAVAFPFEGNLTPLGVAKSALWSFLSEFPKLCGQRTDEGKLARSLRSPSPDDPQYILCPPAGQSSTFVMGSSDGSFRPTPEGPVWPAETGRRDNEVPHVVTIDPRQSFRLRDFVVTNAEYELFETQHRTDRTDYSKSDTQPAVNVSWFDASIYCFWPGQGFRLPTETEWECACRAITSFDPRIPQPAYWYGNEPSSEFMNFRQNKRGTTPRGTFPVSNAWELLDMLGNVFEWCSDQYRRSLVETERTEKTGRSFRVLRGGSWDYSPQNARCAIRYRLAPDYRNGLTGFRLSRTP